MDLPNGTKLLFVGDSITDCGRGRPIGDRAWGNGYVALVEALLTSRYPERKIRVINQGLGGNTVRDLAQRWQTDVLDFRPDWLVIMIGINDVWRQFDNVAQPESGVPLAEYQSQLAQLVEQAFAVTRNVILMTPFFIESNTQDPMRARMDEYGTVVKCLAEKHSLRCVDTQAAFNAVLKERHSCALAGDRVHPNLAGHAVLARALLNVIRYSWCIDSPS